MNAIKKLGFKIFYLKIINCKVVFLGHIGNDFDHQKRYKDSFFIKRNIGYLIINYRSITIRIKYFFRLIHFFYSRFNGNTSVSNTFTAR